MIEDVRELSALMFRYCELFDTADYDAFAALFEHGEWHVAGPGSDAVRRWIDANVLLYDGLPRTKHVTANVVVDVAPDRESATGSAYVTIFQAVPGFALQPIFAGRYRDRFERRGGNWSWVRREVVGDLYGDLSHHVRTSRGPQTPTQVPAG